MHALTAQNTRLSLNWWSRLQGSTARSTPDAEVTALDDSTFAGGLPLLTFFEYLTGTEIPFDALTDNEGARQVTESGASKRLAYMKRTQRVSIGALYECYQHPTRTIGRIESKKNGSDILTKPLDHQDHWTCMLRIGLGTLSKYGAPS